MQSISMIFYLFCLYTVGDSFRIKLDYQKWTFTNGNKSGVARVPGDIFSDLQRNGLISDPYYGDMDLQLRWVPRSNWTYSVNLNLTEDVLDSKLVFLEFDGVDGTADIYLDGQLLGQANNQFRTFVYNVTSKIKQQSKLELKFPAIVPFANRLYEDYKRKHGVEIPPQCTVEVQHGECHVNFLRKTQSSFSWDWGPSFPTVGLYKSVSLVYFQNFHLKQISPLVLYENKMFFVRLKIDYQCDGLAPEDYNFMIGISELGLTSRVKTRIQCKQGAVNSFEYKLKVGNSGLRLWYPRGYGEQKLYQLQVTANYKDGKTWQRETLSKKVGFRYVELDDSLINGKNESLGRNYAFLVNSIPIFLKGANFIPTSVFPSDFSLSKLEFLFYSLVQANGNTIRVWGGGNWPDDEFFDLADQYGVLVFHDLMFACALYPTDSDFLSNIKQEITEQILRIRNHPSILIYSGNNELEVGITGNWWFAFNYTAEAMIQDYSVLMPAALQAVKDVDPSALLIRSSPSNGNLSVNFDKNPNNPASGDVHFYNEAINLWKVEDLIIPRCATEFGVFSFPLRSTMLKYIPESEWYYTSRLINLRDHHSFGTLTMPLMISHHFTIPMKNWTINMDNFAYLSQLNQAIATRTQIEHYRRYRSQLTPNGLGHTMCALYWQLNDVWAAPTWSSIDFDQRWKAAHYHVKHAFAPVSISLYLDRTNTLQIYVISDLVNEIKNAKLRLRMLSLHDKFSPIFEQNYTIIIPPLASTKIEYGELGHSYDQDFFFKAELYNEDGSTLGGGFLPLDKMYSDAEFGTASLKSLKQLNANVYEVEIEATDVVPFVWLDLNTTQLIGRNKNNKQLRYHFNDNAFYITEPITRVELHLYSPQDGLQLQLKDLTLCWIYSC